MTHATTSEHPRLGISLRTRTRTLGILNLAFALRGKSTGWGKGGRPRRTFIGHYRNGGRHHGRHFIEVVVWRGAKLETVWSRRIDFRGESS